MSTPGYDIFISYKREREARVEWLKEVLEEAYGFSVWWDGALRPGIPFAQQLRERMSKARLILVFLCSEAVKETSWVKNEIEAGLDGKKLFTVSFGDDSDFPEHIRALHLMSITDWNGDPRHVIARKLSRRLKERLGTPIESPLSGIRSKHEEWCDVDCPWKKKNGHVSIQSKDALAAVPRRAIALHIPGERENEAKLQQYPYVPPTPTFVTIPAGSVMCGARRNDPGTRSNELPAHLVSIARPFALSRSPVTVAQWEAFRKDRDPSFEPSADPPSYPKVNVTWYEARAYAEWLSEKSRQGIIYRLPSEAEWEYAARGGPGGEGLLFGWGNEITPHHANYDAARSFRRSKTSSRSKAIAETEKYPAGKFELYGMHGNVAEWVADCYHPYTPHPSNGEAVEKGEILGIVRGGSYISPPEDLRCAARQEFRKSRRAAHVGFRVAHNGPAVEED